VFPEIRGQRPKLFRIQRDTRFSPDKSPYKTHVAGYVSIRNRPEANWAVPGLYVHFGLEESLVAVGRWELDKDTLQVFRRAVADDRTGTPLQKTVDELKAADFHLDSHETLK